MRLRIDFGYDGTDFHGWAAQPGLRSVEQVLSSALTTILRAAAPVRLTVAGRTDAGVHAVGAVCHADVDELSFAALPGRSDRSPGDAAVTRLNGVLPADLVVRSVAVAPPGFDARFSALERRYRYRICDDVRSLDPVRRRDTVLVRRRLDVAAMDEAAGQLTGLHDFAAYCKQREGATTTRTLLEYGWTRDDEGILVARVRADAFCHSMVRSLVGAAVAVGEGRRPVQWPAQVLSSASRASGVHVMAPQGLTLVEVRYPAPEAMAARAAIARARRDGAPPVRPWLRGGSAGPT